MGGKKRQVKISFTIYLQIKIFSCYTIYLLFRLSWLHLKLVKALSHFFKIITSNHCMNLKFASNWKGYKWMLSSQALKCREEHVNMVDFTFGSAGWKRSMPFLKNTTHKRIKIILWQVNSPNSQDNFHMSYWHIFGNISSEICSIWHVFVNLKGFHGSTWILLLCDPAKYQKPCKVVKVFNDAQPIFELCRESTPSMHCPFKVLLFLSTVLCYEWEN